jgi:hypothetical protein
MIYAALVISDCDECGFNDLGKQLFGGMILAIVLGIVISILWRRAKDRQLKSTAFVSIRGPGRKE